MPLLHVGDRFVFMLGQKAMGFWQITMSGDIQNALRRVFQRSHRGSGWYLVTQPTHPTAPEDGVPCFFTTKIPVQKVELNFSQTTFSLAFFFGGMEAKIHPGNPKKSRVGAIFCGINFQKMSISFGSMARYP